MVSSKALDRAARVSRIAILFFVAGGVPAQALGRSISFTLPGGVAVRLVELPFVAAKHRLKACRAGPAACFIDGRMPFGTDGEVPVTYVKSITATIAGRTYAL